MTPNLVFCAELVQRLTHACIVFLYVVRFLYLVLAEFVITLKSSMVFLSSKDLLLFSKTILFLQLTNFSNEQQILEITLSSKHGRSLSNRPHLPQ